MFGVFQFAWILVLQINEHITSGPTAFCNSSTPENSQKDIFDLVTNFANTLR